MAAPPGGPTGQPYGRDLGEILRRYLVRWTTGFRLNPSIQPVVLWSDESHLTKDLPPSMGLSAGSAQVNAPAGTSYTFKLQCMVDTVLRKAHAIPTTAYLWIDPTGANPPPGWAVTGFPNMFVQVGHSTAILLNQCLFGTATVATIPPGFPVASNGNMVSSMDRMYIPAGGAAYIQTASLQASSFGFMWEEPIGTGTP
jgi:hypothetical protein